jgi:hypothetical protein
MTIEIIRRYIEGSCQQQDGTLDTDAANKTLCRLTRAGDEETRHAAGLMWSAYLASDLSEHDAMLQVIHGV